MVQSALQAEIAKIHAVTIKARPVHVCPGFAISRSFPNRHGHQRNGRESKAQFRSQPRDGDDEVEKQIQTDHGVTDLKLLAAYTLLHPCPLLFPMYT